MNKFKISDICTLLTDYVANGSFADLKENVNYTDKENGYARLIRLVDYNNKFAEKDAIFVDKMGYEYLQKSKLFGDEIIISNVGINLGTCFLAPKLNYPMTLAPNSIILKTNQIDKYIYYYFQSTKGLYQLKSLSSGSAIPKFNKTDFKKLEICIHNIEEQQHIVDTI